VSLKSAIHFSLVLALVSGCSLFAPKGPSDVARGEYYAAGKPEFDSFFIELHQKQVELLEAPTEPVAIRKNLAEAVALTPDASDESLKERWGQELKKLASSGLRLRLEVPEPSTTLDASATLYASETSTTTPLRKTLPQEATRLVRSRNRMLAAKAELDKLAVSGISLEGSIDQAFRTDGPWKRDEVRKNLGDGQKVITLMQSRAQEVADVDQKLLALVGAVATTDANLGKAPAYVAPPPAEEPAKPAARRAPPAKPSSTSGAAKPAPASKPAPKPRGDDDAAPAPKPTQGNAPAEIEP
jgi:hypothetical protein